MKRFILILLVVLSSLTGVMIIESILRLPYFDYAVLPEAALHYKFYQYDKNLGWSNIPNTSGKFTCSEFTNTVNNNSYGMRSKEVSITSNRPRVAVLGDSFTYGYGVEEKERMTEIAENFLQDKSIEILNFGVSGYGPIQYLVMIDKVLAFRPQAVVIAFCLLNDFYDDAMWKRYDYYGPYGTIENGKLAIRGYPIPNVSKFGSGNGVVENFLRKYSRIYAIIKYTMSQMNEQAGLLNFPYEGIYDRTLPDRKTAIQITKLIVAEIKAACDKANIPLLLLAVPTKGEYASASEHHDPTASREAIAAIAHELDIPLSDPTESLSLADFFKIDGHWTRSGQAKMGAQLAHLIRQYISI